MAVMSKEAVETLLSAARSGGAITHYSEATGITSTEPVKVDIPDLEGINPELAGKVSVQLDLSRSAQYNKVSISVWATTPCAPGGEAAQAERLTQILNNKAQEYMDEEGFLVLQRWAQG